MRGGVSLELERFGWTGEGSVLEVAGRWRGPRPRRLGEATLAVEAQGRRRLTPTIVSGDVRADPEPTLWRAEYAWDGGAVGGFELEVGSNLVIELPAPEGAPRKGGPSRASDGDAVRAQLEAAHRQIEAHRVDTERLRDELSVLRRDALELDQTREFLRLAQATAEAERKAVRAAREESAARRAADGGGSAAPKSAAELAREEIAALKLELEKVRAEATAAHREAEEAQSEVVRARASAGVAAEELVERQQALQAERDAAIEEARRLRDRPAVQEPLPAADRPRPLEVVHAAQAPAAASVPMASGQWQSPTTQEPPRSDPPDSDPPTEELGADPTDTLVLDGPRRREPVRRPRERVTVVPQRTAPAPRRYAQRPPTDSPALRAIAGVLLLLLVVVLIAVLALVV